MRGGNGHAVRFVGGPHHNRVSHYSTLPRTLIMLDAELCYHEYMRVPDNPYLYRQDPRHYRYIGPLGRPQWAAAMLAEVRV